MMLKCALKIAGIDKQEKKHEEAFARNSYFIISPLKLFTRSPYIMPSEINPRCVSLSVEVFIAPLAIEAFVFYTFLYIVEHQI